MKITKTEKVVKEEIDVQPGTYYFEDGELTSRKFVLYEPEDNYSEFDLESLYSRFNTIGIERKEDGAWDENDLPYSFKQFILGIAGKKIGKEEYYKERQQILDKLCSIQQ